MGFRKVVKTRLVRIGNSRGVRVPGAWLKRLGLRDEVEIAIETDRLVIRSTRRPRQGWDARFRAMHEHGADRVIELPESAWDEQEWQW